jgi:hypothetical protein
MHFLLAIIFTFLAVGTRNFFFYGLAVVLWYIVLF